MALRSVIYLLLTSSVSNKIGYSMYCSTVYYNMWSANRCQQATSNYNKIFSGNKPCHNRTTLQSYRGRLCLHHHGMIHHFHCHFHSSILKRLVAREDFSHVVAAKASSHKLLLSFTVIAFYMCKITVIQPANVFVFRSYKQLMLNTNAFHIFPC